MWQVSRQNMLDNTYSLFIHNTEMPLLLDLSIFLFSLTEAVLGYKDLYTAFLLLFPMHYFYQTLKSAATSIS